MLATMEAEISLLYLRLQSHLEWAPFKSLRIGRHPFAPLLRQRLPITPLTWLEKVQCPPTLLFV